MNKTTILATTIAALFLLTLSAHSGFAKQNSGKSKGTEQQISQSSDPSMNHSGINSGRDFGKHVKEHNDHFSGEHNPGKNHKGYSGLKTK